MDSCSFFPTFWFPLYWHTLPIDVFLSASFHPALWRNCAGQHQIIHLDESELKKKTEEHLINQKMVFLDSKRKPEFTAATDTYLPIHNMNLWVITYSTVIEKILFFSIFSSCLLLFSFFLHLLWKM